MVATDSAFLSVGFSLMSGTLKDEPMDRTALTMGFSFMPDTPTQEPRVKKLH